MALVPCSQCRDGFNAEGDECIYCNHRGVIETGEMGEPSPPAPSPPRRVQFIHVSAPNAHGFVAVDLEGRVWACSLLSTGWAWQLIESPEEP